MFIFFKKAKWGGGSLKGHFDVTNQIKMQILMNMHQDQPVSMVDPLHYFLKIEIGG